MTQLRMFRYICFGTIIAVGFWSVLFYDLHAMPEALAFTVALATFVLFLFFKAFNARVGDDSALSPYLLSNIRLWLASVISSDCRCWRCIGACSDGNAYRST